MRLTIFLLYKNFSSGLLLLDMHPILNIYYIELVYFGLNWNDIKYRRLHLCIHH